MFAQLGPEAVVASSSGEVPLAKVLSDGIRGAPDVGVLATRAADGRLDILLWHYHDDDVARPPAEVRISLTGLAPGLERHARVWRGGSQHGGAVTAWEVMGSPAQPNKQPDRK